MRHIKTSVLKTTLLCVSGLGLFAANAPAYAGGCGLGVNPALCQTGVSVNPGTGPVFDNMSVHVRQPMGHLRSINYQRAPNVSITRVHGMMDTASLSDAPSAFTSGCNPTSTAYCRQDSGVPVNVEFNAPQMQPMPQMQSFIAPAAPRIVAIGGGYDPSKFIPRQYGENTFTPGIVYAPTSFINRNPADAARVLAENGYSTGSYGSTMNLSAPLVSSGMSIAPAAPIMSGGNMLAGGPVAIPFGGQHMGGNYLGSVVTGQTTTGSGAPSENAITGVDGSGGYWEQVSGLTMFGDTVATSVVCRRQAPQQTTQIVSPVYGVPQAVPTPVPYFVDVPYKVRGNVMPQGCRPVAPRPQRPHAMPYGPTMGPQFGGGFGHGPRVAPTVSQMGGFSTPHMNTGWTY